MLLPKHFGDKRVKYLTEGATALEEPSRGDSQRIWRKEANVRLSVSMKFLPKALALTKHGTPCF